MPILGALVLFFYSLTYIAPPKGVLLKSIPNIKANLMVNEFNNMIVGLILNGKLMGINSNLAQMGIPSCIQDALTMVLHSQAEMATTHGMDIKQALNIQAGLNEIKNLDVDTPDIPTVNGDDICSWAEKYGYVNPIRWTDQTNVITATMPIIALIKSLDLDTFKTHMKGLNPNQQYCMQHNGMKYYGTMLGDAIKYDRLDIAEYLLTHGADPNKLSTVLLFNEWDSFEEDGSVIRHLTPLVMASEKDGYNEHTSQLIRMLIHFGANPYDTTSNDTSGGIIP